MNGRNETTQARARLAPFILIVSLFLFWGVANGLNGVLVKTFRKAFTLDYTQSMLVDTAFYIGYFVFAIPASLFIRRYGYKSAVIVGLLLYGTGMLLFYPAAEIRVYGLFLGALFVTASGLSFLETSANPLVTVLGPPHSAERRLNFAQSFNAFGPISAVLIGRYFILSNIEYTPAQLAKMPPDAVTHFLVSTAHAVEAPYLVLSAIIFFWAALVTFVKFPAVAYANAGEAPSEGGLRAFAALLKRRHYVFGVVAQFFYVGAQAGIWGQTILYAQHAIPGMHERTAADYLLALFVGFLIGRFVSTALMGRIKADRLMAAFAVANIALTLTAALVGGLIGLYALVASSFFMSIMFPTIFASAIRGLGPLTKTGSSFLIMAIIGGATLPLLMGLIAKATTIQYAMVVPAVCFAVVFAFAVSARGREAAP